MGERRILGVLRPPKDLFYNLKYTFYIVINNDSSMNREIRHVLITQVEQDSISFQKLKINGF